MPAFHAASTGAVDEIAAALLRHGIARSEYILDLNGALHVPDGMDLPTPWCLPSRLFRFPIETYRPARGQPRQLGLVHPRLAEHPFVRQVEDALGLRIGRGGAPNEHGYSKVGSGR